jgi:putative phosphoribosyl transferase
MSLWNASRPERHVAVESARSSPGAACGTTAARSSPVGRTHLEREIAIAIQGGALAGTLTVPPDARGLVIFAHGSGSGRFSPRNRQVASGLQDASLATLLLDLLLPDEDARDQYTAEYRFDVQLRGRRLAIATQWAKGDPDTGELPAGYFGASTGAAAALIAAADEPDVAAIVSRGGRPDLAGEALARVVAPTLLIVGGADMLVLELNRRALHELGSPIKELAVVPGATHLFEEPGALEEVTRLAADWLRRYLGARGPAAVRQS